MPATGAYPLLAGRLPKFLPPHPSLDFASLGMLRMGLSWDVSSGLALLMEEVLRALGWHVSWGDRGFGSRCDAPECCLLSDGSWVVLLSSLMKLWALRAGMGNCAFQMGFGEGMCLLGEFATLPVAPGAISVSPWEFLKMHITQT